MVQVSSPNTPPYWMRYHVIYSNMLSEVTCLYILFVICYNVTYITSIYFLYCMNTEIKSQKAKMNLNVSNVEGIKLVKNSSVFAKDGFVYAVHYGTVIFQHDMTTKETLIDLHCSTTSDRLIRRCLNFYGVNEDEAKNTHDGDKWNYSEGIYC